MPLPGRSIYTAAGHSAWRQDRGRYSTFHNGRGALGAAGRSLCAAVRGCGPDVGNFVPGLTPGGELALTSDYIYRGVSESDGHGAVQGDLHRGHPGRHVPGRLGLQPRRGPGAGRKRGAGAVPRATASTWQHLERHPERAQPTTTSGASSYEPSADYQEIAARARLPGQLVIPSPPSPTRCATGSTHRMSPRAGLGGGHLRAVACWAAVLPHRRGRLLPLPGHRLGHRARHRLRLRQCRGRPGSTRVLAARFGLFHDPGSRRSAPSPTPSPSTPFAGTLVLAVLARASDADIGLLMNRGRGRGHLRLRRRTVPRGRRTAHGGADISRSGCGGA